MLRCRQHCQAEVLPEKTVPTGSTLDDVYQSIFGPNIDHRDRQIVVHAHRDRRTIHYAYPHIEGIYIRELLKAAGITVFLRVFVVDCVHLCRLDQNLGIDLHRRANWQPYQL